MCIEALSAVRQGRFAGRRRIASSRRASRGQWKDQSLNLQTFPDAAAQRCYVTECSHACDRMSILSRREPGTVAPRWHFGPVFRKRFGQNAR